MNVVLEDIERKVEMGESLSDAELDRLAATEDLTTIGALADAARRRACGTATTYVRVAELAPADDGAASSAVGAAREIRWSATPATGDGVLEALASARAAAEGRAVSAFSLAALAVVAREAGEPLELLLRRLAEAGLESVAEAPLDLLDDWPAALSAVRAAGLRIARLTLHGVPEGGVFALLRRLRASGPWPSEVGALAPLPRYPDPVAPTTGYDEVKAIALARLAFPSARIQVDWSLAGAKLAQVALLFGANDIDTVPPDEASDLGPRRGTVAEVRRNITAASLAPVERDGRFELVER